MNARVPLRSNKFHPPYSLEPKGDPAAFLELFLSGFGEEFVKIAFSKTHSHIFSLLTQPTDVSSRRCTRLDVKVVPPELGRDRLSE